MIKILILLAAVTSCRTVDLQNPSKLYRKDMEFKIDGKSYDGVAVIAKKAIYRFKAKFHRKAEVFKLRSCHRELVWHKLGLFGKEHEFDYQPDPVLEQKPNQYCPIEIGAFDTAGQHSWAFIDFVLSETLSAELACNGNISQHVGVSVCQSRASLIQRLSFKSGPIKVFAPNSCAKAETDDGKTFIIQLTSGKCVYLFQDSSKSRHRLTTFGYDDVMMR